MECIIHLNAMCFVAKNRVKLKANANIFKIILKVAYFYIKIRIISN